MNAPRTLLMVTCLTALAALGPLGASVAQEPTAAPVHDKADTEKAKPPVPVKFARDTLVLSVPAEWRQVRPRSRIIELEFDVPPKETEEDETNDDVKGRLTVTVSGGGVEGNIARWIGQFRDIEPTEEGEKAKIEKKKVAGMPLHVVDISGTFLDSPRGPFGPKTELPKHRMVGAILQTPDAGTYFFKFVGPQALVKDNAKAFREMLLGVKATSQ